MSRKILIVDDDELVRNVVADLVEKFGFEPVAFSEAESAYDYFMGTPISIILLDIVMGGTMNGVTLCSKIKHQWPLTYAIAMTGHIVDYEISYLLGVGFNDVLLKPTKAEELKDALDIAARLHRRWRVT